MRHLKKKKILKREPHQRRSLYRQLARDLFWYEKIVTTEAKAKALRPRVEKLMTKAKKPSLHIRRQLIAALQDEKVVEKMLTNLSKKYANRPGGYVRIVKLGNRMGDNAPQARIELV